MASNADRLRDLTKKDSAVLIGETLDLGGADRIVTVRLKNGKQITAIAGNEINSSQVSLIKADQDSDIYYAFCGTSPEVILSQESVAINLPKEEIEEEEILPFQVILDVQGEIFLGGDRPLEILGTIAEGEKNLYGITNKGNQEYVAGWFQDTGCNLIRFSKNENISSGLPFCPFELENLDLETISSYLHPYIYLEPAAWVGFGYFKSEYLPLPLKDETTEETGEALPLDAQSPPYHPRYGFREKNQAVRQGTKTNYQYYPYYYFFEKTTWDYLYRLSGNSPSPIPPYYFASCSAVYAIPAIFNFSRETKADYTKKIKINLTAQLEIRLSDRLYTQPKTITYEEEYSYHQTPALTNAGTFYQCVLEFFGGAGFFAQGYYQPNHADAHWSGEIITQSRSIQEIIREEEWDYPINFAGTTKRRDLYSRTLGMSANYTTESNDWHVQSSFPFGFMFESPGEETINTVRVEEIDRVIPELKLLGANSSESFYQETQLKRNIRIERNSHFNIPIFLYNHSHEFPEVIEDTETTVVITENQQNFLCYAIGSNTYTLNQEDSFYFEVTNDTDLSLQSDSIAAEAVSFSFVFRHDDDPLRPVARIPDNIPLDYTKVETFAPYKVSDTITYQQQRGEDNKLFDNLQGAEIHLVTFNRIYFGKINNYVYSDYQNPEFELETYRDITSITVILKGFVEFQSGMVEEDKMGLYSIDNCTALLRDKLLTPDHIAYCNLVNGNLYYSRGVIYNLTKTEQTTQVFSVIEDRVTYSGLKKGQFIAIDNTENPLDAKGVAFYPSD